MDPTILFIIVILIVSVIIHEVLHGVAAEWLGDPTARRAGRITLNPLSHVDLFGSLLIPAFLVISGSPVLLGWAKPVPYDPRNIRGRHGEAIVAAAGPASNAVLAIIFGLLLRLHIFDPGAEVMLFWIVLVNISLCIFNLLPIPPLDGSKALEALMPRSLQYSYREWRHRVESGFFSEFVMLGILFLLVYVFGDVLGSAYVKLATLIVGG